MNGRPYQWPDQTVYPDDLPLSWTVPVLNNGIINPDLDFYAPVTDDGLFVANLVVVETDPPDGYVTLTLNQDVFDLLGRYSTWRLRETTMYRRPLVQGRLIKAV